MTTNMTKEEKFVFLDNLMLENNIFPIDEENCREKKAALIESMETIFDLKNPFDYTCLFAIAELLADSDKIDDIQNYLLKENQLSAKKVKAPEWEDKVLVATAMEDNPLFFSMAYNWILISEQRIKKEMSKNKWSLLVASSAGFQNFGDVILLQGYGNLGFRFDKDSKEIQAYFTADEAAKEKAFIVKIRFKIGNKEYSLEIEKDQKDGIQKIYSLPESVEIDGEFEIINIKVDEA